MNMLLVNTLTMLTDELIKTTHANSPEMKALHADLELLRVRMVEDKFDNTNTSLTFGEQTFFGMRKKDEPKAAQEEPKAEEPKAAQEEPKAEEPQQEEPKTYTLDDVSDKVKALMREDKALKPRLLALLNEFGAKRTSEVKPEDYAAVIERLEGGKY